MERNSTSGSSLPGSAGAPQPGDSDRGYVDWGAILAGAAIAAGTSQYGMQTFDQSIFGLFQQGVVSYDEALRWATNVDEFKLKVQGISTTADISRDQMTQSVVGKPEITRFGS